MSTAANGRKYQAAPPSERFWAKVRPAPADECWEWTAGRTSKGYGNFTIRKGKWIQAHRWAYQSLIGGIPPGLVLDHLCRNRGCVNPWHLEPVTNAENIQRGILWNAQKRKCKRGHPLSGNNLGLQGDSGYRYCKACRRMTDAKRRAS